MKHGQFTKLTSSQRIELEERARLKKVARAEEEKAEGERLIERMRELAPGADFFVITSYDLACLSQTGRLAELLLDGQRSIGGVRIYLDSHAKEMETLERAKRKAESRHKRGMAELQGKPIEETSSPDETIT